MIPNKLLVIDDDECGALEPLQGVETMHLKPGELKRRTLVNLLAELSAGVEEVITVCKVLEYSPLAEALLVYKWLLGRGYRVHVLGGCNEKLVTELGFEKVSERGG